MSRYSLMFVVSVFLAPFVFGQAGPPDTGRPRHREHGERRGPGHMLERVAEELELDDAQREEFEAIMAAQRARMEEMAPRWEEIREAIRNGDRERAAELRAELGDERGPHDLRLEAFDEIEPILNDEQHERFMEMRERIESRLEDREEYRRMLRELPDEVGMDDAQREQFRGLLQSRRSGMHQQMAEMRPLFQEMREAEESGDQGRVEELRSQFREFRPNPEKMRAELLDQVSELLREDQKPLLAEYYADLVIVSTEESPGPTDVRTILRAARRLHLRGEQKSRLKTIGQEAMRELRAVRSTSKFSRLTDEEKSAIRAAGEEERKPVAAELKRRNEETMAQLAASTRESILKMLDEGQAAEFERRLQRYERRERKE